MILRFAGSAAEIFAKFREIEDRCAALERQPIAQADFNRAPPARETPSCKPSDPSPGSLSRWPLATPPES